MVKGSESIIKRQTGIALHLNLCLFCTNHQQEKMERRSTAQRDEWIRRISLAPDQMYQHEQNNNSGKVRISTFILEDICHRGNF